MEDTQESKSDEQQILELGIALGQRRAFGMVAGRCGAARAECLRRIKEEKVYLKFAPNWGDYCERHLKINVRTADRMLVLLKKHGPLYFETAALTGISPAEYGLIEHAIQKDGIHVGGEVIALIPENAARAIDAVAQLQAEASEAKAPKPPASVEQQLRDLEKRGRQICAGFQELAKVANCFERQWLIGSIENVGRMFDRLQVEIR